jgi:hypothetical protein
MAEDGLAPTTKKEKVELVALGATTDSTVTLASAPFAGVIEKVTYSPSAAVTGAATNFRTLSVINKGQAGTGTNVAATLALESGKNLVAYEENVIPVSTEETKITCAEGDEIAFASVHTGTGLADPGGLASVTFKRT